MKTGEFNYHLPETLIAQSPLARRDASRLLVLHRATGLITHTHVKDLTEFLSPDDLLVVNRTRVIPARLFATKDTGAKMEVFLLKPIPGGGINEWEALVAPSKRVKGPTRLALEPKGWAEVGEPLGRGHFRVTFTGTGPFRRFLETFGHVPLPPYIQRPDEKGDKKRYQTVFAKVDGSVAAPTAGLHFTPGLLKRLRQKGIRTSEVVLHVGLGTFLPMETEDTDDHVMHSEAYEVPGKTVAAVKQARAEGHRVVAVGTTSCRALESASMSGELMPSKGDTRLFIKPGYQFKTVDALFTNFHQPLSTLLMLVSSFAGRENIRAAYEEAIREKYRFLSYGDAMLIL